MLYLENGGGTSSITKENCGRKSWIPDMEARGVWMNQEEGGGI